mmetsp:Transcript_57434/g.121877  ORF Transcript_57434/g.121877 Transcript_57434/m.121877 type:complete len:212 (-) Transcript_57434:2109-2744(-)
MPSCLQSTIVALSIVCWNDQLFVESQGGHDLRRRGCLRSRGSSCVTGVSICLLLGLRDKERLCPAALLVHDRDLVEEIQDALMHVLGSASHVLRRIHPPRPLPQQRLVALVVLHPAPNARHGAHAVILLRDKSEKLRGEGDIVSNKFLDSREEGEVLRGEGRGGTGPLLPACKSRAGPLPKLRGNLISLTFTDRGAARGALIFIALPVSHP